MEVDCSWIAVATTHCPKIKIPSLVKIFHFNLSVRFSFWYIFLSSVSPFRPLCCDRAVFI